MLGKFNIRAFRFSGANRPLCDYDLPISMSALSGFDNIELVDIHRDLIPCIMGDCINPYCVVMNGMASPRGAEITQSRIRSIVGQRGTIIPVFSGVVVQPPAVQHNSVVHHHGHAPHQHVRVEEHIHEAEPIIEEEKITVVHQAGGGSYVQSVETSRKSGRQGESSSRRDRGGRRRRDSPEVEEASSDDDRHRRSSRRHDERRMIRDRSESRGSDRGHRERRRKSRSRSRDRSRDHDRRRDDRHRRSRSRSRDRRRDYSDRED